MVTALGGCRSGGRPVASPSAPAVTTATTASTPAATPSPTPPAPPVVIGVIGDYGYDAPQVRQVVRVMGRFDHGHPLDAVVTTGDNAYEKGRPAEAAFALKALAPLLATTPLYAALGNHDVVTAGGRYVMGSLRMPARWYTARVGPVELVVLDSNRTTDPAQVAFLKRVLARPRRGAFRVVVFHHPAVSCSLHPADVAVGRAWVPLFRDRVDLVLSGHNHSYERFTTTNGPAYVTTGGGGAELYPSLAGSCGGPAKVAFLKTVHHAVRLTANATTLTVEAVGLDGKAFDRVVIAARRG
jgi:3',5'-cyclic AMP phosphodiesterase CpdA